MAWVRIGMLFWLSASVAILFHPPTALASKRVALVIGNGAYQISPLKNPGNDAEDISAALKNLDFTVTTVIDADRRRMTMAIHEFGQSLQKETVGLFYYAGHGLQVNGTNYLLPVDALIHSEQDIPFEALNAGRVLAHMESAGNELNIAIFDACRNNPYARSFRDAINGLAHMDPPRGSLIVFSTGPNSVAVDGQGRNGTFTKHFLKYLNRKNLELGFMMRKVRADVESETDGLQSPYEVTNVKGAFYFALDSTEKAALPPAPREIADFDDKLQAIQRWNDWQAKMTENFNRAQTYDSSALLADEKVVAWKSFIHSYGAENPYSEDDDTMLQTARARLAHWQVLLASSGASEKPAVVTIPPQATPAKTPARQNRYIQLANGIVQDNRTRLEWYIGPNRNTTWQEARWWVRQLSIDGAEWRMPTIRELMTLYAPEENNLAGTSFPSPLKWRVWSGEKLASGSVGGYDYDSGHEFWGFPGRSRMKRAYAVRSQVRPEVPIVADASAYEPRPTISPRTVNAGLKPKTRFKKRSGSIIVDTLTGFEWRAGPDRNITYHEARHWINKLNQSDQNWRMPNLSELVDLYEEGAGTRNMSPYFQTSGWLVWSERNKHASSAWDFYYNRGEWYRFPHDLSDRFRVFAVRSRSKGDTPLAAPDNEPTYRYVTSNEGIIRDTHTGLEWFVGPDTDMTWTGAKQWAEGLSLNDGKWQLPTVEDLKSLIEGNKDDGPLPANMKTNGSFVWSHETRGATMAWGYFFGYFGKGWLGDGWKVRPHDNSDGARALAARTSR